jgi:hypothetical protein
MPEGKECSSGFSDFVSIFTCTGKAGNDRKKIYVNALSFSDSTGSDLLPNPLMGKFNASG